MKRILPPDYGRNATIQRIRYCRNHRPTCQGNNLELNRSTKEELAMRRAIVVHMRSKGISVKEISERFGVHTKTIWRDLKVALKPAAKFALKNSDALRQLELYRLDRALEGIWDKIKTGSFGAVDLLLKMSRVRSAFLGLDAGTEGVVTSQALPWSDEEEPVPWGMSIPDRPTESDEESDTESDEV